MAIVKGDNSLWKLFLHFCLELLKYYIFYCTIFYLELFYVILHPVGIYLLWSTHKGPRENMCEDIAIVRDNLNIFRMSSCELPWWCFWFAASVAKLQEWSGNIEQKVGMHFINESVSLIDPNVWVVHISQFYNITWCLRIFDRVGKALKLIAGFTFVRESFII
jgi:hypothetical protein